MRGPEETASHVELTRCPECEGRGWLHMTSLLHGRQVQRCDTCRQLRTDEDAQVAHELACGCAWDVTDEPEGEETGP